MSGPLAGRRGRSMRCGASSRSSSTGYWNGDCKYPVATRELSAADPALPEANVHWTGRLDARQGVRRDPRDQPLPSIPGRAGAMFWIDWGEVSADRTGRSNVRAGPGGRREALAAQVPELTVLVEPCAPRGVCLHLWPGVQIDAAQLPVGSI